MPVVTVQRTEHATAVSDDAEAELKAVAAWSAMRLKTVDQLWKCLQERFGK